MKKIFLFILSLAVSGCATVGGIQKAYQSINRADGIDGWEAKIIAQKQLLDTPYETDYYVSSAQIIQTVLTRDHPEYWFVGFAAKNFDMSFWEYLVVIHKKTGEVAFSGGYVPLGIANYDWVFNPEAVKTWRVGDGA